MKHCIVIVLLAGVLVTWPCSPGAVAAASAFVPVSGPVLAVPIDIPAQAQSSVVVPIHFTSNGHAISSVMFSIDFDQTWLTFDPADSDGDGVPDSVDFSLPAAFSASVIYDPADSDGELDFLVADVFPPLASLPDSVVVSITFQTSSVAVTTTAQMAFSTSPPASFGNTSGQSVAGTTVNGSIRILGLYDLNDDGHVDVLDIQLAGSCWQAIIGGSCPSRFDVNRDSVLDIVDVQMVAGAWGL